jgi:hypothetical protein
LAIVDAGADVDGVLDRLRRTGPVTQRLGERIVLVALGPDQRADPPPVDGVSWYVTDVPTEVLDDLAPAERDFVAAWRTRAAKRRPGDGLSWDAPGFAPPDRPTTS